jgi:DNA-binding LacI/PurR family transcriptional regulator
MVSIRDIAKLSGYSTGTVSRVINQQKYVSAEARKKIQAVIVDLDYVPNAIAQDLSEGTTKNVGVILPHTKHPYFTQLLNGIMDASFHSPYQLVLLPSEYNQEMERNYLEGLRRKAYHSLIFTSYGLPLEEIATYQKFGPIVCCKNPGTLTLSAAYSERKNANVQAFQYLKQQKVQQLVFLFSRPKGQSPTSTETLQVFQEIYQRQTRDDEVISGITTYDDGYRVAQEIANRKVAIEAIFTNGDDIAAGILAWYAAHHVQAPLVIGQENQLASRLLNIPTIDHHFYEIGKTAFKLSLVKEVKTVGLESTFILRNRNVLK